MSKNEELKNQLEEEINKLMIERRKRLKVIISGTGYLLKPLYSK